MRALILGGSGFIGSHLAIAMANEGYDVEVLSRNPDSCIKLFNHPKIFCSPWDGLSIQNLEPYVEGCDVVINLIGESLGNKKWSETQRSILLNSRLNATKALAESIKAVHVKPKIVVQASAVGFYGYDYKGNPEVDEFAESGKGFLSLLTQQWEDAILPVKNVVQRLLIIRSGIVLHPKGGFLQKLFPVFNFGAGGYLGDGYQPFPWIALEDEVGAIIFLVKDKNALGVYNLVAPQLVEYRDFTRFFSRVIKRPAFLNLPEKLVKVFFGEEKSKELLLGGRFVLPRRLVDQGYIFKNTSILDALETMYKRK